jgi:hypothetical protein
MPLTVGRLQIRPPLESELDDFCYQSGDGGEVNSKV